MVFASPLCRFISKLEYNYYLQEVGLIAFCELLLQVQMLVIFRYEIKHYYLSHFHFNDADSERIYSSDHLGKKRNRYTKRKEMWL